MNLKEVVIEINKCLRDMDREPFNKNNMNKELRNDAVLPLERLVIKSKTIDGDYAKQVVMYHKTKRNKENQSVSVQKYILLPNEKLSEYHDFRVLRQYGNKSLVYQCFCIKKSSLDEIVNFVYNNCNSYTVTSYGR